jgi:hypothetical protein
MSERTIAGRSLAAFRRDPNFTGAFVGGPPLLSADEVQNLVDNREEIAKKAAELVARLRKEAQASKAAKPRRRKMSAPTARSAG